MMKLEHPQELEVWYIIPAIKKELARCMMDDYKMSQKQVAGVLGITESAVSQYVNSKRAKEVEFSQEFKALIKQSTMNAIKGKHDMIAEIQKICGQYRRDGSICTLHKKIGIVYEEDCKACQPFN